MDVGSSSEGYVVYYFQCLFSTVLYIPTLFATMPRSQVVRVESCAATIHVTSVVGKARAGGKVNGIAG